jgi:Protein of unknown function (DUF2971)
MTVSIMAKDNKQSTQIYYHFLSTEHAIDDLENKRIKISTINSLNDPFELLPYLRFPYAKRQQYYKIRKNLIRKWGFVSFSTKWEEPLLWSHYAERHAGIALGFNIKKTKDRFIKVEYDRSPLRKQIELTDDKIENEKLFLNLAKIKYGKWEYEEEFRLIVSLNDVIKENCYFLPFGQDLELKEIRLGAKFAYKSKIKIDVINKFKKQYDANVIPCRLQWQGYYINKDGGKRNNLFP